MAIITKALNEIDDKGIRCLSVQKWKIGDLDISYNPFTDGSMKWLSGAHFPLEHLHLIGREKSGYIELTVAGITGMHKFFTKYMLSIHCITGSIAEDTKLQKKWEKLEISLYL